ncbi:N4 gp36-like protein [Roseovarius Plymouth podovirus 1]|uniref:N4 gp36-like protein n=2 Tax=Roseovarius Plymouth podovirus 1 TaxID=926474 RepID=K4Q4Y5_9CAUD|nr:N4 gp36-like protein [Roseovarius Plymouth podovirus 1]CBW47029.1 N4 gp36-like protein [Roseovarius sp. 217 phage 1]CBX87966.1 N4 gp36-like protein [Roseovarius Plymouth podovirus 1]
MFAKAIPAEVFAVQREFIRSMGGKLDFLWAAETLVVEETKELREAYEKPETTDANLADIFKEGADLIYVVCHFYNTMPVYAVEVLSEEQNQRVQSIIDEASSLMSTVSHRLQIPLPLFIAAFEIVHASNMSKLDDDGKPVRREDGKIMKGPNYVAPDMMPIVEQYKEFLVHHEAQKQGEVEDAEIVE